MLRAVVVPALALMLALGAALATAAPAPTVAEQLAAAKKAAQPVFLVVTEPRARRLEALRAAVLAAKKKAPRVRIVELDRSLPIHRDVVKRYGLAGVGTPMVLVLAHNGAPGGGVGLEEKTTAKLLALLPSPRKADTLLALFERKAAFVVVGRPDMPSRAAALAACRAATKKLDGKAAVVEVDLRDKAEQGFLEVLGADLKAQDVVVHVYGFSGRKTGALAGSVGTDALVTAANKKEACCPGGKCG